MLELCSGPASSSVTCTGSAVLRITPATPGVSVALESCPRYEWRAIYEVLEAVKLTKRRLDRMDEDEANLVKALAAAARKLGLTLPTDCVAGSKMLFEKFEETCALDIQHQQRREEVAKYASLVGRAKRDLEKVEQAVEALCAEARCDEPSQSGRGPMRRAVSPENGTRERGEDDPGCWRWVYH